MDIYKLHSRQVIRNFQVAYNKHPEKELYYFVVQCDEQSYYLSQKFNDIESCRISSENICFDLTLKEERSKVSNLQRLANKLVDALDKDHDIDRYNYYYSYELRELSKIIDEYLRNEKKRAKYDD